jgi:hypothetical protein
LSLLTSANLFYFILPSPLKKILDYNFIILYCVKYNMIKQL